MGFNRESNVVTGMAGMVAGFEKWMDVGLGAKLEMVVRPEDVHGMVVKFEE